MTADLATMRQNYSLHELDESSVDPHPIQQLRTWISEAVDSQLLEPNAMTLATVDASGGPTTRVVLLKEIRDRGVVFYTNYESRKGQQINHNPRVCLNFLWLELQRQVRIEGIAHRIDDEESKLYFQSRPKESQIGAWASRQSEPIPSRVILEKRFRELEEKYHEEAYLPLPPYWGGYLVEPVLMEFWQGRMSRLHDRVQYQLRDGSWIIERLSP
ncbi:MAG: pyridoxamine 5'-phosphate oxidase [Saprospiraceae bacterium]|nr:pyridoxamine 5'-phosphate oxidase [Saprospiraceae bacterium]